jgi:hypothetical protein
MLEKFVSLLETSPDEGDQAILQVCGGKRPSTFSAGIFVTSNGNTSAAQESLRAWSDGRCSPGSDGVNSGMSLSMRVGFLPPTSFQLPESAKAPLLVDEGGAGDKHARSLAARAECKAIQAVPNDGCWSLAKNCGISQSDFGKYNAGVANLCASGIQNGSYYCCSAGTLPDRSPKPLADGTCYTVTANSDTRCYLLENQYHIPTGNIEEYNKHTWGWTGCSGIIPGMKMCLSKGDPPMPTILGDVQCGPQKPGTTRPKSGTNLETLNPCPLNACCDGWGKCGTTKEFCTPSPAGSGAPGAFKPGTNGCFSNCGTNIINNKDGPDLFARIAYFEAWNTAKRNCSTLDADDIPNHFTHVHYAFVDLSPDGVPDPSRNQDQFVKFKNRRDWKRIPSFGGWAYSTELGTYRIMRDGVLSANRERFATNIVKWVVSNGFDGVDFDWEYPGEPDIPDIPPEGPEKGKDYLEFLKLVRQKLPRDKTLSIAAPASFWYLKAFPISDIAKVVDYFIYMTYE